MTNKDVKKLLSNHQELIHSDAVKVTSHVQRQDDDWYINTLMIDNHQVPFIYKRKKPYQSLKGARVNITYYRDIKQLAGMDFETMKVVRLKVC
ncbi:hypothetical protein [Thalassotalea crassostreae]|uniref:hypothetical protein n=1 Tax=Thalassotalea crassostreae TaxID=1763536 RepID=UPI0008397DC4|nr:hypothetical protein [Thalassotalea crassostreae]